MASPAAATSAHYQLTIPSLSALFGTAGRYRFHNGQHATIAIIKRLSAAGVWLVGFRGRVLRAHSHLALPVGRRVPVALFVEGDTLRLRLLGERSPAVLPAPRPEAVAAAQFARALSILRDKGFSNVSALAELLIGERGAAADASARENSVADRARRFGGGRERGMGGNTAGSSSGRHSGQHAHSGQPHDQMGDPRGRGGQPHGEASGQRLPPLPTAGDTDADRPQRAGIVPAVAPVDADRARLLVLFNHLASVPDTWIALPFALECPSVVGTMRLRLRTATHEVAEAIVIVERSPVDADQWAIAARALHLPHPQVTLYAKNRTLFDYFDSLRADLRDRLRPFGIDQVLLRQWDHRFTGFDAAAPETPVAGINIHV